MCVGRANDHIKVYMLKARLDFAGPTYFMYAGENTELYSHEKTIY